jgi:predicted MFS family arabinose efflux permease
MVFNGSMLFGPSVGGALIPFIDTKGCFFVATVGNLIVLMTIFLIRIPMATRPEHKTTVSQDMKEGLALAWNTPIFVSLFAVLGIVTFCTRPYTQFMPVFARDILQVGAPGLGLLLMAPGAGAILGGLTLASIRRFPKPHYLLFYLAAGFASAIIFFALSRHFLLSLFFYSSPAVFRPHFFPPLQRCCKSIAMKPTGAGSCLFSV